MQAAEATDQVDDGVFFLEGFIRQGVIEFVEGLFDFVGSPAQANANRKRTVAKLSSCNSR